jgi:glyoxylase-like metal-dependent hydrolase (beta-lactamase superfamily II)
MQVVSFTGGLFDTNCFFLPGHGILIDAPQDTATWLNDEGFRVRSLLLTHGHIDHVWDAAAIRRIHGCRVGYHPDGLPMLTTPDFFKQFGFNWEIETVPADFLIEESESLTIEGREFRVLHVPGHCPGSLCFFAEDERLLFGGDVLFAGSIGRTDLPGGDTELLLRGIREKLWPLGDDVKVLPGHGPATTIGIERQTNPFVGESAGFGV